MLSLHILVSIRIVNLTTISIKQESNPGLRNKKRELYPGTFLTSFIEICLVKGLAIYKARTANEIILALASSAIINRIEPMTTGWGERIPPRCSTTSSMLGKASVAACQRFSNQIFFAKDQVSVLFEKNRSVFVAPIFEPAPKWMIMLSLNEELEGGTHP